MIALATDRPARTAENASVLDAIDRAEAAIEQAAITAVLATLEADTAAGEHDGDHEADPNDWPAWTDNWFIGLAD